MTGLRDLGKQLRGKLYEVLLCLGLAATAFMFIPGSNEILEIKYTMAVLFATALGAIELHKNGIKPFANPWLPALIAFIPISLYMAPDPVFHFAGIRVHYFWSWEPFALALIFMLFIASVASHPFSSDDVNIIMKLLMIFASFSAGYMILQFFFADQFMIPLEKYIYGRGQVAGFVGNPTLASPYVAMMVPIAYYYRSWWLAALMVIAVILSDSQMAYGALLVSCIFYFGSKAFKYEKGSPNRKTLYVLTFIILISSVGMLYGFKDHIHDNERFKMWKLALKDVNAEITDGQLKKKYPYTGRGIGSFRYAFHSEHPGEDNTPNGFWQAHNEYVQTAYNLGGVGIIIFFASIVWLFLKRFQYHDRRIRALMASFVCIATNAAGTFVWQVGTTMFATAVIVGLLHNRTIGEFR